MLTTCCRSKGRGCLCVVWLDYLVLFWGSSSSAMAESGKGPQIVKEGWLQKRGEIFIQANNSLLSNLLLLIRRVY